MIVKAKDAVCVLYAPIAGQIKRNRRYNAAMLHALKRHPDSICTAVSQIEVQVTQPAAASLVLRYIITGKISDLSLPVLATSNCTDELWQHTCCEAFIGTLIDGAYYEFNFSPSTQWAAYRFSAYREGMRVAVEVNAPQIKVCADDNRFELQARVECNRLRALPANTNFRLGLSAVIEEQNGRKSYWSLAHPPGKPDFHRSSGFIVELAH